MNTEVMMVMMTTIVFMMTMIRKRRTVYCAQAAVAAGIATSPCGCCSRSAFAKQLMFTICFEPRWRCNFIAHGPHVRRFTQAKRWRCARVTVEDTGRGGEDTGRGGGQLDAAVVLGACY